VLVAAVDVVGVLEKAPVVVGGVADDDELLHAAVRLTSVKSAVKRMTTWRRPESIRRTMHQRLPGMQAPRQLDFVRHAGESIGASDYRRRWWPRSTFAR
jgi:hypothetical protein